MRRAARRDENEGEIVRALRRVGAHVVPLSQSGVPDLLVCYRGKVVLLEVIGDEKAKKYAKSGGLTPAQVKWHRNWPAPIAKAGSVRDAILAIGAAGEGWRG